MNDADAFDALGSLLEAGRDCVVPVWGTSMFPYLKQGDRLHICRTVPEELRLGDLIAFRREDRLVVHRFAGRVRQDGLPRLRQKGDNLSGFGLVAPQDLLGRVAWVETATVSREMLRGSGRRRNALLGCRAWVVCLALELRQSLVRRIRRAVAR